MTSKRLQRPPAAMAKLYFYSPKLDECVGCEKRMGQARGVGTVILTAPGSPKMHYTLCNQCATKLNGKHPDFVRMVERRIVARAKALGAYEVTLTNAPVTGEEQ